ncbi:penicillin-binding protein activator LpoB [Treponema parvum]|uniref:Penicillin-binding protein activator LpoB n=1 Tax=Treponema parvum TaxID=138851 RepID=A0A975IEC2_9SPIR|nr:penicillin-binding protein activator LpoB [Treponema parvum]QTQ13801.1 penicillin-binding protein activator LpoB [Treponema parvum]
MEKNKQKLPLKTAVFRGSPKKLFTKFFILLSVFYIFAGCSSTKVTRVSSDTQLDLSGYWNDTDVRIVAEAIISECLGSQRIKNFSSSHKGRLPVVILGSFRNQSDEHIDTSILTAKLETALVNSGLVDFVASSSQRKELDAELEYQQTHASEESAKNLANATGADFMMQGSVKTIVDSNAKTLTRTYYVSTELIDIESHRKIWINENDSIKKVIGKSSVRK